MNNEIGRKITSLTLMTIMLVGGMVIAAPSMVPEAQAANQTLFVSAESSVFNNTFSGPQVIEIVVSDPAIASLDEAHGSPDVTVDGSDVLMAQGNDGSWYGYIVDETNAGTAQAFGWAHNKGISFGGECTVASAAGSISASTFSGATNVFFPVEATEVATSTSGGGSTDGTAVACDLTGNVVVTGQVYEGIGDIQNVVRGAKTLANNSTAATGHGQIGLADESLFPFVQTYSFNQTGTVEIEYNKAGENESVTLIYDSAPSYQTIDRVNVPDNAQIMLEIGDPALNIDPTSIDKWVFQTVGSTVSSFYMDSVSAGSAVDLGNLMFDEGDLLYTAASNSATIIGVQLNADWTTAEMTAGNAIGMIETGANTSVFVSWDAADKSTIFIDENASRGESGKIDYNVAQSIVMVHNFGELSADADAVGNEWNSGEGLPITLVDDDLNLNTRSDEDLDVNGATVTLVPTLVIGSPVSLTAVSSDGGTAGSLTTEGVSAGSQSNVNGISFTVDSFSKIARVVDALGTSATIGVHTDMLCSDLSTLVDAGGTEFLSVDLRTLVGTNAEISTIVVTEALSTTVYGTVSIGTSGSGNGQQTNEFTPTTASLGVNCATTDKIGMTIVLDGAGASSNSGGFTIDFMSFGTSGTTDSNVNNSIYRMEMEETGDNTGVYEGSIEYVMSNQLNMSDSTNITSTVGGLSFVDNDIIILVTSGSTDEDAPRLNYLDLGADGVSTQIAVQQDAPSHSGVADLDMDTYKIADTVVVTITDMDLNVDSELIDIYTVQNDDADGVAGDTVLFNITFDDSEWTDLDQQTMTLVETGEMTGVFTGTFQVPSVVDASGTTTTTGTDMEVNYMDYRDAGNITLEVGDGAGIRANTGSVSLDRSVYPVPWGLASEFATITSGKTPNGNSIFPIHSSGIAGQITDVSEQVNGSSSGDVTIHVRVSDADLDVSAVGEDKMNADRSGQTVGPIKISISRGTAEVTLAYAGGAAASETYIAVGTDSGFTARQMGPVTEVAGDAGGVFELDFTIEHTDGPASATCPTTTGFTNLDSDTNTTEADRFGTASASGENYCILQGDILTVEYTDAVDASGSENTVTDSATFDLRNGVLQADKSVYLIGSDMIITVIEPDWDRESDAAESYDLDAIEWDSAAATGTIGNSITIGMSDTTNAAFDPEPSAFRETGDSTGIFQVVLEVPSTLSGNLLERGEAITLEYMDWGPAGADFVGQENEDMSVTVYTSNFGATVELDQKVYTWTDKVYITIVAPDHNMDSNLIDRIGDTADDAVKITTRSFDIDKYKLVETGTDTGIFTGEVILTGFSHAADGSNTHTPTSTSADSTGPTNGFLETASDDGLTVSFEYSDGSTVVGSALIRWNIGEVQWLESSYPASGTGVVRIIDPDMNLNPESVDNFNVATWSDSDAGGINLTVTETNESTGIFEGTVFFTVSDASSGHRLRVSEGDTVTTEYMDNTLPSPYTNADDLAIAATSLIGTVVPPLERAPAANLRTVDAFGNSLNAVSVDQQVQLTADLANGQDKDQAFAYLVQVQDGNGVTVSLAWITGSLSAGQSFSPALSWIPTEAGSYTATAFVWESVDNPTALSPSVSTSVNVN